MNPGSPRKLTDAQIAEIRAWDKKRKALGARSVLAQRKLPKRAEVCQWYGISERTLSMLLCGRTYKVPAQRMEAA